MGRELPNNLLFLIFCVSVTWPSDGLGMRLVVWVCVRERTRTWLQGSGQCSSRPWASAWAVLSSPILPSLYVLDILFVSPCLYWMRVGWWLSLCYGFCKAWHLISYCLRPQVQMCSKLLWGWRCRGNPAELYWILSGIEVAGHLSNTPKGICRQGTSQRSGSQSPTQLAEELLEVCVIGMSGSPHHDS